MSLLPLAIILCAAGFLLLPRLRPRSPPSASPTRRSLSIIIPARNEEHNLPNLLPSIAQHPQAPPEIIVVNDASTDRTAEVAQSLGARVLASQPLPDGWRGKTWACHQGAQAATGELLLFLDADTWLEPGGLDRILAQYSAGALSIGPYHAIRRPYENLSLFFNLSMTVGTVPLGLFGQMLLIDRTHYWQSGGHAAVKGHVLENFHLAERLRQVGCLVRSAPGRGLLSFRMYPKGLRELIEGWTKGFAAGAGQTPRLALLTLVAWMIGLMLVPLAGLLARDPWPWTFLYLAAAAQVAWFGRQIGAFSVLPALVYPIPLTFFFALFARSALRSGQTVQWKGRQFRTD